MPGELRAKRDQKPWQGMEQKQTDGRGVFPSTGSNQPKPRAGRRQTAQGDTGARTGVMPPVPGWQGPPA